jgi:hypothetical protein
MTLRCVPNFLAVAALVLMGGCSNDSGSTQRTTQTSSGGTGGSSTGSGGSGGSGGGTGGSGIGGSIIDPGKEAGVVDAGPCFTTCDPTPTTQYCGRIGVGCSRNILNCDTTCRTPGYTCGGAGIQNTCGANVDSGVCTPTTCDHAPLGKYCGKVDNGCGAELDCGGCANGWTCGAIQPNTCGAAPDAGTCTRATCNPPGGSFCGEIGDGCGGKINCMAPCPTGLTCGGTGIPGLCATPVDSGTCQNPTSCDHGPSGQLCGIVGDGCGGQVDCGNCTQPGYTCGGAGIPGSCGTKPPACTLNVCNPLGGLFCGDVGDGCGGTLHCNTTCPGT